MTTAVATKPAVLSAGTMKGNAVRNTAGEDLGNIEEIMLDVNENRIAYAVLSFGGFLGLGEKLFAIPWEALTLDDDEHSFILNVSKERLKQAEGFDKDNWPRFADRTWGASVYNFYDIKPYWTV